MSGRTWAVGVVVVFLGLLLIIGGGCQKAGDVWSRAGTRARPANAARSGRSLRRST